MAVQAQYPSNILLFNRNTQESNKNNMIGTDNYYLQPQQQGQEGGVILEQSHMFFNNNGVGVNPRKRSREMAPRETPTRTRINSFNFSIQSHQNIQNHQFIDLSQLQNQQQQQHQSVVSTGLKLSFGEQKHQQIQQNPPLVSLFSQELTFQFKQHIDELNYFLNAQGEQMRRALAEKSQRHYRALLDAAQEAAARRIEEKEAEVETATRLNAELHAQVAQISAEAQAWQAKAQAQESHVVSLQAQIQQAMIRPNTLDAALNQDNDEIALKCTGDAEDAESAYIDPFSERRLNSHNCKACHTRAASVILLPCRHLCVCVKCDGHVLACPVCYSLRSASVEVYFS